MNSINIPKILFALSLIVVFSCSKTEENVPLTGPQGSITVDKLVRKASLRDQVIPFSVLNEAGDDVTSITTFYVDGQEITGSSFSSSVVGDFEVYGIYTENGVEITTNTEAFSVIIPKRKVVLEDYTGTWCGYCPSVAGAIEDAHDVTSNIAVIALHETANSSPDPMHFEEVQTIQDEFGVSGLPAARINRTTVWTSPYSTGDFVNLAGTDTDLAIAMVSEISGSTLTVKVDVVYENGSIEGDKLVLYLLESGIIHDQTNYYNTDPTSPYYQMGNPIPDFVHNEVLRQSLTQVLGDGISTTAALIENSKTYTTSIPSDYNVANLSLVAMVVSADNSARNAQFAHVSEDKAYE
jgi:thiol-disulfide isomerase/thioredoxin